MAVIQGLIKGSDPLVKDDKGNVIDEAWVVNAFEGAIENANAVRSTIKDVEKLLYKNSVLLKKAINNSDTKSVNELATRLSWNARVINDLYLALINSVGVSQGGDKR